MAVGGEVLQKISAATSRGILAWVSHPFRPPPPKICGTPGGPPVTAPRVKLSDGRHLAYKDGGVPKDKAKHKIIFVHGFDSYREHDVLALTASPELVERLGVYFVSFDRPGYGESDPDPNRSVKSLAFDIEQLADQLDLGRKFYVIGFSMGGQAVWGCLKYIPHRLAGATLLAPVANYWWSGLPKNLAAEAYKKQKPADQWALRVAHYAPWLTHWWNTQKWFPGSSVIAQSMDNLSRQDKEIMMKLITSGPPVSEEPVRQQGEYYSVHQDLNIGFGKWDFCPTNITKPFPNYEGTVHFWQGDEDLLVPHSVNQYIAKQHPWIQFHEVPGAGHMVPHGLGMTDAIIKAQLSVE